MSRTCSNDFNPSALPMARIAVRISFFKVGSWVMAVKPVVARGVEKEREKSWIETGAIKEWNVNYLEKWWKQCVRPLGVGKTEIGN